MNFMDLLLADAIAAGMARQAAEASRPPPDNFFIIPPDVQAWRKLYLACKEEHMVICVEITDDNHAPSRRIQPHIVDLAREISQIPFFRAKIGPGRTFDQLRDDLGGIRFTPSVVIVFFDDDTTRFKKAEGEEEIKLALRVGAFQSIIKEYIDQRLKLKLAERFAEQLADDMARRRRQAAIEYEAKLKREREELEKKTVEEERQKRIEAEKKAEEAKASEQRTKLKAYATEELLKMDLNTAKIRDIKDKMDDLGIGYAGCTSRDDLIRKLTTHVPALKSKMDQTDGPGQSPTSSVPSSYSSSTDRRSIFDTVTDTKARSSSTSGGDTSRLQRKIKQLEDNVEELNVMRESLDEERTRLQARLKEKDNIIQRKDREIAELKNNPPIRSTVNPVPAPRSGRVKELEDELLETRMLYTCTLDDIDVLGTISKGDGVMVVRAECTKPDVPNHDRVYAMKILLKIHDQTTLTKARNQNKNEYEVLSSFAPHNNIVRLFAFFYDRPMTHPKLKECGEGIALCIMMEQLSQNMDNHLRTLKRTVGPNVRHVINWFRDLLTGLQYLYSCEVVHRDLKLENLMMSNDVVKIVDFGEAIKLSDLKLPYEHPVSKGGNEAHLAPEILNQRVGKRRVLDYTKQPIWASGVLAYELAGHQSPFSGSKDQKAYDVKTLSSLSGTYCQSGRSQMFPPDMPRLVEAMLDFDPSKRPTLEQALARVNKM